MLDVKGEVFEMYVLNFLFGVGFESFMLMISFVFFNGGF